MALNISFIQRAFNHIIEIASDPFIEESLLESIVATSSQSIEHGNPLVIRRNLSSAVLPHRPVDFLLPPMSGRVEMLLGRRLLVLVALHVAHLILPVALPPARILEVSSRMLECHRLFNLQIIK